MTDLRTVAIDYETIQCIESVGEDLLRQQDNDRGLRLLTLVLTWRTLGKRGQGNLERIFECDVDESAGLAEVVELHNYSRCVK